MSRRSNSGKYGFTMIELLIVIGIISILVLLGLGNYGNAQRRARDVKRKADLGNIQKALELYYADHGRYPPDAQGINCSFCVNDYNPSGSLCGGTRFSEEIAPYLQQLPHDPRYTATSCGQYDQNYLYTNSNSSNLYQEYWLWAAMEVEANATMPNTGVGGRPPQDYYVIRND